MKPAPPVTSTGDRKLDRDNELTPFGTDLLAEDADAIRGALIGWVDRDDDQVRSEPRARCDQFVDSTHDRNAANPAMPLARVVVEKSNDAVPGSFRPAEQTKRERASFVPADDENATLAFARAR